MLEKFWSENLKARGHSGDTCILGRIILKLILINIILGCGPQSADSE
jgi:hypothetical protein